MSRLQLYQDTIFFFVLAFIFFGILLSSVASYQPDSHPLSVVRLLPQEDGGNFEISG